MTRKEIKTKIKELNNKLMFDAEDEEMDEIERQIADLEEEYVNHEMSYDMTVTIRMKVRDVRACSTNDARAIVYDMFKNNKYGVVENVRSEVDDEHEIDEAV